MKKLRVTVEGKVYEVLVEMLDDGGAVSLPLASPSLGSVSAAPIAAASSPAPSPAAAPAAAGPGIVPSPLAGKVVSVDVKVGDTVAAGAQVATLEAMKMNTYINAPIAGRVEAVMIQPGDAVDEGAPLLRIV